MSIRNILWEEYKQEFSLQGEKVQLAHYRRFVYEKGGIGGEQKSEGKYKELSQVDRFRYRTRYFTDSGIIGTKEFVSRVYQEFKRYFNSRHEKRPKLVQGLDGFYSANGFLKTLDKEEYN